MGMLFTECRHRGRPWTEQLSAYCAHQLHHRGSNQSAIAAADGKINQSDVSPTINNQ